MLFPNVLVIVPFSKSTVFKICRQNMCHFRVNGKPIRHIFHPFQNVPASCGHCLNFTPSFLKIWKPYWRLEGHCSLDIKAMMMAGTSFNR